MSAEPEVIDRSAARAALLARYRDLDAGPPFPGAVSITCVGCGCHILWTNPPVPPGRTYCRRGCSGE